MADLYGIIDSNNNITKFYVSPDFGMPGSNTKLISNVARNKAGEYPLRKIVNGADGFKYKWISPNIVEKTDTEIKASLEWKQNKRDQLTRKATLDIKNLGEEEVHSLIGVDLLQRLNSGPAMTQPEINKIQEFEDARQAILDGMNSAAGGDDFSKAKKDTVDTDAPDIDVKTPSVFAVDDQITIIDDGTNPKEETATIATIVGDKLTFDTVLTNTTKYKQNKTWVYKTG